MEARRQPPRIEKIRLDTLRVPPAGKAERPFRGEGRPNVFPEREGRPHPNNLAEQLRRRLGEVVAKRHEDARADAAAARPRPRPT